MNPGHPPKTRLLWPMLQVKITRRKVGMNRHFQAWWASQPWGCLFLFAVLLQEMPSYNDKRRGQAVLVPPQTNHLQRCHSNPTVYYGRAKILNGVNGGSSTLCIPQQRRHTGVWDVYSAAYGPVSADAGRRHCDAESVQSMSVSSASSLSGRLLVTLDASSN